MVPAGSPRIFIYYDGACPICLREIRHYLAADRQGRLEGVDISSPAFDPQAEGLDARALQRWLHVRDSGGRIHTGVDGFRVIWAALPGWRWLSRLAGVPGIHAMLSLAYRLFAANRYRLAGRCATDACSSVDAGLDTGRGDDLLKR